MSVLPMFPLGTVLFPQMPLPLQIFEPRYLTMLREIEQGEGRFGVVLIERGFEVGGGDQRFPIGTVATVEQTRQSGGRVQLLARGQQRFEVTNWLPDDPYPRATVRLLPEFEWDDQHASQLAHTERTIRQALAVISRYRALPWAATIAFADDPVAKSWQLAGIAPVGAIDQLDLLQSSSLADLLDKAARLTTEAMELIALQFPDAPA